MPTDEVKSIAEEQGFGSAKRSELGCWMQKRNKAGAQRLRFFAPAGRLLNYYVDAEQKQYKGFLDLCAVTSMAFKEANDSAGDRNFDEFTVRTGGENAGGKSVRTWSFRTERGEGRKSMGRICRAILLARSKEIAGVSADAAHSGIVWKRKFGKRWIKRFLFLKPATGALVYTVDEEGSAIKGSIPLASISSDVSKEDE